MFGFKIDLSLPSCPDFKRLMCPFLIVKFSTHLHPTAAPKPQENPTKWGWCCQRAAGLSNHWNKPQHDAGPGSQRPCITTSPTAASRCRDVLAAGDSQGWRCSRSITAGRQSHLSPGRELMSHQGLQGGISPRSVLPPHPSPIGITGSLGWWLLLV